MTFADLLAPDAVFLDANTFIYHFSPDPVLGPLCSQLLQRIENQEMAGFTSVHLLAKVAHKLMTIQASALFGWPLPAMANRLRRHPAEVQQLTAKSLSPNPPRRARITRLKKENTPEQGEGGVRFLICVIRAIRGERFWLET